ncbi:MAG: M20 metallopeptidase family protein [Bacillota bacterium]
MSLTLNGLELLNSARAKEQQIIAWRRQIHRYPELGFAETETASLVTGVLTSLGITVRKDIGRTGVVGLLEGGSPGPVIALRADMDALPIQEETGLDFASLNPGVMHACGHDAHVSIILGAALLLHERRSSLAGTVKLIFQPCEENPPGGALAMIQGGVLEEPVVDAILGMHVYPYLPAGAIGWKEGPIMAAADMFVLEVHGKGGHGASPHQTVDAVMVAAEVIQSLQTIVSRRVDPLEPSVISVGTINGGYKNNIIADKVVMTGTVRTLDPDLRLRMPEEIKRVIDGIGAAHGATCSLEYQWGFPPLVNNSIMADLIREAGNEVVGTGKTLPVPRPSMGGEDFAYFAQKVPGAYFYLGVGKKDQVMHPWHNARFDLDESALPVGAAVIAWAAHRYLSGALSQR